MILTLIGFACLAHLVADFANYLDLPQKPFQCNMCMGFWLSVIPFIVQTGVEAPLWAAACGVFSDLIYRLINRV